jgi:hypothetical protein
MLITRSCSWMPEGARVRCRAASHLVTPTNRAKARPIKSTLLPNTARFDARSHGPVTRTPPLRAGRIPNVESIPHPASVPGSDERLIRRQPTVILSIDDHHRASTAKGKRRSISGYVASLNKLSRGTGPVSELANLDIARRSYVAVRLDRNPSPVPRRTRPRQAHPSAIPPQTPRAVEHRTLRRQLSYRPWE